MRVLITGVSRGLGPDLARRLERHDDVRAVFGLDVVPPRLRFRRLQFFRADLRQPSASELIKELDPDVVVHLATQVAATAAIPRQAHETNVMGTMNVLAGSQRARRLVVKSSTAVYSSGLELPSLLTEEDGRRGAPAGAAGRDLREVELTVREFAMVNDTVDVVVLRLGQVLGRRWPSPLAEYLALEAPPTVPGFDPRLQLLSEDAALEAVERAALGSHAGVFNVAGQGVLLLSQLLRLAGRRGRPILPPMGGTWVRRQAYRAATGHDLPDHLIQLLSDGQAIDCRRLEEASGWRPRESTADVAVKFAAPPAFQKAG